jgi:hypothetical protein
MAIRSRHGGNKEVIKDGRSKSLFFFHAAYLTIITVVVVTWVLGQRIPLLKSLYAGRAVHVASVETKHASEILQEQLAIKHPETVAVAEQISYPEIKTYEQLLKLTSEQLAKVDIGLMNLLCTQGLPGAENLDINECLKKLDYWAEHVRKDTELRIHNFQQNPAKYDNSENVFKMVNLVLTLKEDMGIHYNLENMARVNYSDSREIFIHGPLSGGNHGSCTNLPVFCISIARRLGYPIKLVSTSEHYFLRWEDTDKSERFNIEVSCTGTDVPKDEHYKNWPRKLNELDYLHGYYLKSLSPTEELAAFLHLRGDVLKDIGRSAESLVAYAQSYSLVPDQTVHLLDLAATVDQEVEKLAKRDYLTLGKRISYTVSRSMDANDLSSAWIYRYPKVETALGPVRQNGNFGQK